MRFVVADTREVVMLAVPGKGKLTIRGKFKPRRRVLELTDAQAALFAPALAAAVEAKVLFAPAGWTPEPAAPAPPPAPDPNLSNEVQGDEVDEDPEDDGAEE